MKISHISNIVRGLLLTFLASNTLGSLVFAQTGPGGIGSSATNVLWLKADGLSSLNDGDNVTTWTDNSGNGHNATQSTSSYQPTLQEGEINGLPVVRFDGNNDFFTDSITYDARTVYGVFRMSSTLQSTSELGQFWGSYSEQIHVAMDARSGNQRGYSFDGGSPLNSFTGEITYNGTTFSGFYYNTNASSVKWSYGQEALFGVEFASTKTVHYQGIGSLYPAFGVGVHQYGGDMAEIIVYNVTHNEAEQTIIENYLAAKYDISTSSSVYSYGSTHSNQLIGIGQASDGTNHTSSTGDGILTISNPSGLGNGEYFMVGNDGENTVFIDTCDTPGLYGERILRTWKVGETGDVGTVSMAFDLTGVSGLGSVSDLALIQSSSTAFTDATIHTTGISLASSQLSFTNVDLSDGDIFTIAQLGSTVYYDGSWNNGSGVGNIPSAADSDKKLVVTSGTATLTSDAECKCLVMDASTSLSISNNTSITIENGIVNNGTITVADGSSIVQTGSTANSGTGTYIIQRNTGTLTDDTRYQYWSAPISDATMGSVFSGSNTDDFYYFDEGTQNWASQASGSTMEPGRGYITTGTIGLTSNSEDRQFSGTINNGTIQLVTSGDSILAGNPYPSAISSTAFMTENTSLNGTIWFWNHSTAENNGSNSGSDYATWTGLGSTGGNSGESPDDYIQSCQGFFVASTTSSPTITYTNTMRETGNNTQFFKSNQDSEKHRVWLDIKNDSNDFNQILIGFIPEATNGVDRLFDGGKLKAHPRISFYSLIDEAEFSIQGLPNVGYLMEKQIPLGVDAWITGNHEISVDSLDNWPEGYSLSLVDYELDSVQNLLEEPNYSFNISTVGTFTNRFELWVKNTQKEDPNGVSDIASPNEVLVYSSQGDLIIESDELNINEVNVYDIQGRLITSKSTDQKSIRISLQEFQIVIVSTQLEDGTTAKELIYINQ